MRPLLGTTVRLEFQGVEDSALVTEVFEEIERLQRVFNYHDPESELSDYNRGNRLSRSVEFSELLKVCNELAVLSQGYFQVERGSGLDLSGIAKGFIVDKAIQKLLIKEPGASGCVNAGGDLRFFNAEPSEVVLRLGQASRAYMRTMALRRPCVASSSVGAFSDRTYFALPPTYGPHTTAVVQAPTATFADALTKVALFAPASVTESCCERLSALALIFDAEGNLQESFGSYEHPNEPKV